MSYFRYVVDHVNPVIFDGHNFMDKFTVGLWPSVLKVYWILFACNFAAIVYFFTVHMPRRRRRARMIVLEEYTRLRSTNITRSQHLHRKK